jgi:hypothetical protein
LLFSGHPVTNVSLSQDGACLLLSCHDNKARLLDKESGEMLNEYKGNKNRYQTMIPLPVTSLRCHGLYHSFT